MPVSQRATKRQRIPSSVHGKRSTRTWPRTTTPCCLHPSCWPMGSVGVVETVLPATVYGTKPAWATLRRSSSSRLIGEPAVLRIPGSSEKRCRHMGVVSWAWSLPLGRLLTARCEPRGKGGSPNTRAVRGRTGRGAAVCTKRGRPHGCRGRTGRMATALCPKTPGSPHGAPAIPRRPKWCGTGVAG